MLSEEEEHESFFEGMQNFEAHFQEAISSPAEPDLSLYNEVAESEKRYGDHEFLDKGGMKSIYSCDDYHTARKVAIAKLKNSSKEQDFDKFISEARITAALEHPNIMPVYDLDVDSEGEPFFAMKYIRGYNLEDYVQKGSPGIHNLMQVFIKVCDAIDYAHSKGIIHLDLKPANIQMGEYGEVLVCDWGLAKILNSAESSDTVSLDPDIYNDGTLDGHIKGSPGYLAPEQIDKSFGGKSERSDIYALGAILYFLLTEVSPAKGETVKNSLQLTAEGKIKEPSKIKPVPSGLEAVCMKALSVQPQDRYSNVKELKNEVEKWLQGFATDAENAGFLKSLALLIKRHKTVSILLLLFLLVTGGLLFKTYISEKQALHTLRLLLEEKEENQKRAIEESPRLVGLAEQAIKLYNFDEALNFSNLGVSRDPDNEQAWKIKGRVHFIRQEFNAAVKALQKVNVNSHRKVRSISEKYGKLKADKDMLTVELFKEFILEHKHMQFAYLMCGYAELNAPSLDYRIEVALFFTKELTNRHIADGTEWDIEITNSGDFIELDFSKVPQIRSLSGVRNLPVSKLNISGTDVSEILDITKMPLVELDISDAKILDPRPLLKIKTLKKLIIGADQYSDIEFFSSIPDFQLVRK